jgi:hypothetical protein
MAPLLSAIVDGIINLRCWQLDLTHSSEPRANQNPVLSIARSGSLSRSNSLKLVPPTMDVCERHIFQGSTARIHDEVSLGWETYGSSKCNRCFLSAGSCSGISNSSCQNQPIRFKLQTRKKNIGQTRDRFLSVSSTSHAPSRLPNKGRRRKKSIDLGTDRCVRSSRSSSVIDALLQCCTSLPGARWSKCGGKFRHMSQTRPNVFLSKGIRAVKECDVKTRT